MIDWPDEAPPPSEAAYVVYRMDGDVILPIAGDEPLAEDDCALKFRERHGHAPEFIVEHDGKLWLGPVVR